VLGAGALRVEPVHGNAAPDLVLAHPSGELLLTAGGSAGYQPLLALPANLPIRRSVVDAASGWRLLGVEVLPALEVFTVTRLMPPLVLPLRIDVPVQQAVWTPNGGVLWSASDGVQFLSAAQSLKLSVPAAVVRLL
jgi:hypothetical protein